MKAIYEWITDNIAYDVDLYRIINETPLETSSETQNSEIVITQKKAVCQGFSNLFRDLCTASNIGAYVIDGYSKDYDPLTRKLVISSGTHAWNAVKINNIWYLCDPTWSAGSVDTPSRNYVKKRNDKYYLKTGKDFIKHHFPSDPMWQLSEKPLSIHEFRDEINPQTKNRFNYADTLSVFEKLSMEEQNLNTHLRSLRFDADNDLAKSHIVRYYVEKTINEVKVWENLVMSFLYKKTDSSYKKAIEEKQRVYNLLASIEKDMESARHYFFLIPPASRRYALALENAKAITADQRFIDDIKPRLTSLYETIQKMKY